MNSLNWLIVIYMIVGVYDSNYVYLILNSFILYYGFKPNKPEK